MNQSAASSNLILIASGFGAAFLVTLWLSLIIWTYRDIRSRTRNRLVHFLAVLVSAILFLPGVLIYLLLRPARTIEDEYQKSLEEETMLQSIEENMECPGCGRQIQKEWIVCPNCHTRLKKPCHRCKHLLELNWSLCPYCATPVPGARKENASIDDALQELPLFEDTTNPESSGNEKKKATE